MKGSPLIFGVPVYNEEKNINTLLDEIAKACNLLGRRYKILICNDGSTDGTAKNVQNHHVTLSGNVELINQPRNLGVARAFDRIYRETLRLAGHWETGILITLEGDNTSDLKILPALIDKIENENCDVSLASCYAKGGAVLHTDRHRVFLSRCANTFVRVGFAYFGIWHIHTFSSFYRATKISFLREVCDYYAEVFVSSSGFECMVETLARCAARGAVVGEVPMVLDGSLRLGVSKLRVRKTMIGYLLLLAKLYAPKIFVAGMSNKK